MEDGTYVPGKDSAVGLTGVAKADLPAAGQAGRIARVTDDARGLWIDTGVIWAPILGSLEPQWFGASGLVGQDATAPVLAMVQAAQALGLKIRWRSGHYKLSTWTVHAPTAPLVMDGDGGEFVTIEGPGNGTASMFEPSSSITIRNVGFTAWTDVITTPTTPAAVDRIEMRGCKVRSCRSAILWTSSSALGIARLRVSGNDVADLTSSAFSVEARVTRARVTNNEIRRIIGHGIRLGKDTYASQDFWLDMTVSQNTIDDVYHASSSARGILIYGREATIEGNKVYNVRNASGTDCEGIMTKVRFGQVINNTLINGGRQEALINIKGTQRTDTATVQGYDMVVAGNILWTDQAGTKGIQISTAQCWVHHNILEGMQTEGITVNAAAIDDILIESNEVLNCTGTRAINIKGYGKLVIIRNNTVNGMTGASTASDCFAIAIQPSSAGLDEIIIENNKLKSIVAVTGGDDGTAILINTATAVGYVLIKDNYLGTADVGITFQGATAVTKARVEGNDWAGSFTTKLLLTTPPTTKVVKNNAGYVTEKSGATSVADGGTVAHGLVTTPTTVRCNPTTSGEMVSVTSVSTTTFTVAIKKHDGTAGTTQTVYWNAEVL